MRNNICLGMGFALAFAVSANAASFKVNKVGSEEEQSFDIILNQKVVSEASPGSWLYVSPIVPSGKMFKSFTVYDEYGETAEEQVESPAAKKELRFLMPNHDVYVKAYFESLRYYIYTNEAENGSVAVSFSDRMDIKDRTKPGFKVTVTPTAAAGYKLASVKVSKYLDANTTVTCTKAEAAVGGIGGGMWPGMGPGAAATGSCVFEMPNFDVNVSATFVEESVAVPEVDYKDKKFTVTYELNGGAIAEDAAKTFVCDSIAKLPKPTKEGFDFVGWSFENKLDNVYHALDRIDGHLCKDTTVYAIWTAAGTCPEQKAIAVEGVKMPVCYSNIKCALFYDNTAKQDSVCNGVIWTSDLSLLPSSSSVASSSSAAVSSSSATPASSSAVASSSSAAASSSSVAPVSSSATVSSSSAKPASSSAAVSSSSAKPASSSATVSSSSAKPASSSSVKTSSSSAKPASSSSVKASSSSAKATSSSSAKAKSSSSSKAKSSSSKAKSSSSVEMVVESVETEEDLPSCTEKRENVTYYVSKLKKVFVCKDRKWTQFDPSGIPMIARKPSFAAVVDGRQLQIFGAKIGSQVSLFDMQGRVMYNGKADASSFSLNVAQSGSFLLRIGTQQKVVNVR